MLQQWQKWRENALSVVNFLGFFACLFRMWVRSTRAGSHCTRMTPTRESSTHWRSSRASTRTSSTRGASSIRRLRWSNRSEQHFFKIAVHLQMPSSKNIFVLYECDLVCYCFFITVSLPVFVSMKQLRDRVMKLREECDQIYNQSRTEGRPSINWGGMIDEKLVWESEAVSGTCPSAPIYCKTVKSHVLFGSQAVLGNILRRSNIVVIPKC